MRLGETKFLLLAAGLHLTVPVAAAIAPQPDLGGRLGLRSAPAEFDIDVSNLPAVQVAPEPRALPELPQPDEERDVEPADPRDPALPVDPRAVPSVPPSDTSDPQSEPPPDPNAGRVDPRAMSGEPGPGEYEMPPAGEYGPGGYGIPGLDGAPVWQRPGMMPLDPGGGRANPAPTSAPKRVVDRKGATKILQDGVRGNDRKLGLDLPAASAIAAVFRTSLRASDAPYTSSGSFSVTLSGGGQVTAVSLLNYTGGGSGTWQGIRQAALAQLAGRSFVMRSIYAKGAIVGVHCRSEVKTPGGGLRRDGTTVGFDVTDIKARPVRHVVCGPSARPVE